MEATRACKLGALLTICTLAGAGQTPPVEIQIVTYDTAKIGPKMLAGAQNVAGKILSTAGLDAKWRSGAATDLQHLGLDFTARTSAECSNTSIPSSLRIRILAHTPGGILAQSLGFSLPCAETGIQVTIFADHLAGVSQTTTATFSRVLGYAIAHELGHVLLHSALHENTGLMKGVWSKRDWQRATVAIIPFTAAQSRQMMAAIQRTRSTEVAGLSPTPR